MGWFVEVYAASVECADTESVTTDDMFAMVGSVLVDGTSHGFATPPLAVEPGSTHDLGGYPTGPGDLYRGFTASPRLGLIVRGYDIDDNDRWVENRETIKKVVDAIEDITEHVPVVDDIVGIAAKIPDAIDFFVDVDSDDLVLGYLGWIDLTPGPPERTVTEWRSIRTNRSDGVGYSASDYTVHLRVVHRQTAGSLGDVPTPRLRPHKGSTLADWVGAWQGPHVDCAITRATSALGVADVLTVEITEHVDGRHVGFRERAVRLNQPYLADARTGVGRIPTSRVPEEEGGGLFGSGTVEGRAARTEPVEEGSGTVTESVVDVLERSAAGRWTSTADYLSFGEDAVLELYQERVGGQVVGARMRYVRPASVPTRTGAPQLDELLAPRVV